MVFGIFIIILVLLVAFFHMVQGFFSATLSMIFTIFAAAVAVGFHENVVAAFKPGKLADSANAMMLCILFAATYVVLRLIFDRAVPGNVRFQSTTDKIGGAAVGIVAGIFAAGIVAIAAQTMPFGPSVFGYARYELTNPDREMSIQPNREKSSLTRSVYDELKSDGFKDEDQKSLILPADDLLLKSVSGMSEGSLSGVRPLNSIHANYLQEAFAMRVGYEIAAKHTASNLDKQQQVSVEKIARVDRLKQVEDSEFPEIRAAKKEGGKKAAAPEGKEESKLAKDDKKPGPGAVMLIVRTKVEKNAGEGEKLDYFRFTPASIRLVVHDTNGAAKNYHPLGTMDAWGGGTFWPNRIDDPVFINLNKTGMDLVFEVDGNDILEGGAPAPKNAKAEVKAAPAAQIKAGVFLEVKRLAQVDLGGMTIESGPLPDDPNIEVMRKLRLKAPPAPGQ